MDHYYGMNSIKPIPQHELYYNLKRLSEIAKTVAHAKSPDDAEYLTKRYLLPQIEITENILSTFERPKQNNA